MELINKKDFIGKAHRFEDEYSTWAPDCYRISVDDFEQLPTIQAIPKSEYEARLKSDMAAMLEEIVLGIDEMYIPQMNPDYMSGYFEVKEQIKDDIQQKINSLKGDSNDKID